MDHEEPLPRIIKPRRKHSRAFKEQVLAECRLPDESIAGVALRHGLNANLIHKWRQAMRRDENNEFVRLPAPGASLATVAPVSSASAETIRLEVTVGQSRVAVEWPVSRLHQSIDWIKALTR